MSNSVLSILVEDEEIVKSLKIFNYNLREFMLFMNKNNDNIIFDENDLRNIKIQNIIYTLLLMPEYKAMFKNNNIILKDLYLQKITLINLMDEVGQFLIDCKVKNSPGRRAVVDSLVFSLINELNANKIDEFFKHHEYYDKYYNFYKNLPISFINPLINDSNYDLPTNFKLYTIIYEKALKLLKLGDDFNTLLSSNHLSNIYYEVILNGSDSTKRYEVTTKYLKFDYGWNCLFHNDMNIKFFNFNVMEEYMSKFKGINGIELILMKLGGAAKIEFGDPPENNEFLKSFSMNKFCSLSSSEMPIEWNVELYFDESFMKESIGAISE